MNIITVTQHIVKTLNTSDVMKDRKVKYGCKDDVEQALSDINRIVATLPDYRKTYRNLPDMVIAREGLIGDYLRIIERNTVAKSYTLEARAQALFDSRYDGIDGVTEGSIIELMVEFVRNERKVQ
ncbi:hypothetical protein VPHK469_0124 [Vibrio phage K469]